MLKVGRHVKIGNKASALASATWPVCLVAVVAALWPPLQTQWGGSPVASTADTMGWQPLGNYKATYQALLGQVILEIIC